METSDQPLKIGIIGAGISGICTGIQLQKQLNIHDYVIFDENPDVGGVWLVNTYPGCACDIPSHFFSFSFEPNPYWSESFSSQPEILAYLRSVAKKHDLYNKIKFKHQVQKCVWEEKISKWRVTVKSNGKESEFLFDIVLLCLGGLRVPKIPEEFDAFQGEKLHSAKWDHRIKLDGKKVAIVGTGASAVQIIPKIVDKVGNLIVYQRNPPWVVPRLQFSFPSWAQWTFANIPGVQKAFRSSLFWLYEMSHNIYMKGSRLGRLGEALGAKYLSKEFKKDDALQKKLIPSYPIGCKRITPSDEYYQALSQPNVNIRTSKITQVKAHSIITEDGEEEAVQVLILATGFRVQDFFTPLQIFGKGGADIMKQWKGELGPSTYLGMCTCNIPNCFFIIGPNAAPGNTSIIFTVECQVNWLCKVLKEMMRRGSKVVTVDKAAEQQHMSKIHADMNSTVWSVDCGSYYMDHRGRVTALIPHSGFNYWKQTRHPKFEHLVFQ